MGLLHLAAILVLKANWVEPRWPLIDGSLNRVKVLRLLKQFKEDELHQIYQTVTKCYFFSLRGSKQEWESVLMEKIGNKVNKS